MTTQPSAPISPSILRVSKMNPRGGLPVTPQRPSKIVGPATLPRVRSPLSPMGYGAATGTTGTPATPHIPHLSFGSASTASNASLSVLATPSHPPVATSGAVSFSALDSSPEVPVKRANKSVADLADNWRERASENGIRVSSAESQASDDDIENISILADMNATNLDEAILPPSFLSNHRRSRSQSQTLSQDQQKLNVAATKVDHLRTPDRRGLTSSVALNTPPPRTTVVDRLKLHGSLTEPAQPRRRSAFGISSGQLFNIDENEYAPYPHSFSAGVQPRALSLSFGDPFNLSLPSIPEPMSESPGLLAEEISFEHIPPPTEIGPSVCNVCDSTTTQLAMLDPCGHSLCSACLTSALNIVGEKDMQCAECGTAVNDFRLQTSVVNGDVSSRSDPITSTPPSAKKRGGLLPSAFDAGSPTNTMDGTEFSFFDEPARASTPVNGTRRVSGGRPGENVVLRVDNVPWDITPPAVAAWLKQPIERVHVLLDRKGKTLSHAYVELANDDIAKAALRGAQNSVLGKGKRARGVTVTRSTSDEVMRALFPSWQGSFDGSKPSLAGLDNTRAAIAMESGLITDSELKSLLHLIRSPDSHFLKVPSLPFHSLISILVKFPADVDGRVLWSPLLRETLYDVTYAAIQVMVPRVQQNPSTGNAELLSQLCEAAVNCRAFTPHQSAQLQEALAPVHAMSPQQLPPVIQAAVYQQPRAPVQHHVPHSAPQAVGMNGMYHLPPMQMQMHAQVPRFVPVPLPVHPAYHGYGSTVHQRHIDSMPAAAPRYTGHGMGNGRQDGGEGRGMAPIDALAREYGVDASLVEELARRLSGLR